MEVVQSCAHVLAGGDVEVHVLWGLLLELRFALSSENSASTVHM